MDENKIRESFRKAKQDITNLYSEISSLRNEFRQTKDELINLTRVLDEINNKITKNHTNSTENTSTHPSTQESSNQTFSTHPSTHNFPLKPLKTQNMGISTRNQGVSTDRQTDRQTDIRHINPPQEPKKEPFDERSEYSPPKNPFQDNQAGSISDAANILDSLDSIKKEIRLKFKRLTDQEVLVFSTLYQLEEEEGYADYRKIAEKINLTESSIRDYIGRLIKKGIPVDKKRINNKTIHISISENLKKIASLPTILQLRDI
ncbi:MAG: helix-turn-helix domain-containing protein [Candidatus Pacearchaeota archaeon]